MSYAPDPDLFIRTGGEMRISNFLLWQTAYSELYFTHCLWPDFGEAELDAALAAYAQRDRRFGEVRDSLPALTARPGRPTDHAQAAGHHRPRPARPAAARAVRAAAWPFALLTLAADRRRRLGVGRA